MINKNIESISDLTPMQSGILYHKILEEESNSYILQQEFKLTGFMDKGKMGQSITLLSAKYDTLRTIILHKKVEKPRQVVLKNREIEFEEIDLSKESKEIQQQKLEHIKSHNIQRGFDLEKDSLLRITVVSLSEKEIQMIWCAHHIILDGWCFPLLFRDFLTNYQSLIQGVSVESLLQRVAIDKQKLPSYQTYVNWLKEQNSQKGLDYWKALLEGYDKVTEITALEKISGEDLQVRHLKKSLSLEETEQLKKLANQYHLTISTVVETAWGILLQVYNQTDDVTFGKVVSGRNVPIHNVEQMVGLFINTVPVRVKSDDGQTISDLLIKQQNQSIETSSYDFYSLAEIQQQSSLKSNLFQTLFIFENYYVDEGVYQELPGVTIESISEREQTNYPITIKAYETDQLFLDMMYDPTLFIQSEIDFLLDKLILILQQMLKEVTKPLSELTLITKREEKLILTSFNKSPNNVIDESETVIESFERIVEKMPDKVALEFENKSITYEEFNHRVNQLAHYLRKQGVGTECFVGLVFNRSIEMLIAQFAVLKAGGIYVPIEPSFPKNRIDYILSDCQPKLVLTNQELDLFSDVKQVKWKGNLFETESRENLTLINEASDGAYCIYTSGTTGKPKGVIIEHRNLSSYCFSDTPFLNEIRKENSSIISVTNYTFDIFVTESIFSLSNGVKIILANDEEVEDPFLLTKLVEMKKPRVIQTTPSKMKYYLSSLESSKQYQSIELIILGGEPFSGELYLKLKEKMTATIFNGYGPSETTVWISSKEATQAQTSIGHPLSNNQIYLMSNKKLVGIGMLGELFVAGKSVGRGYLNKPELTEANFIENPFGEGKLYATGDLAKWSVNGEIHYMGRKDQQIKIRGYRIELGEIESVLTRIQGITNGAVIVKKDHQNELAIFAYFVSENKVAVSDIKTEMKNELPEYMVPNFIMQIDHIPMTTSGKLDYRNLPENNMLIKEEKVLPRNTLEQSLVDIYQEVLGATEISIHDSFFSLGGHSLKITQIVNKVERATGTRVPIKVIFNYQSVAELAQYLENRDEADYVRMPKAKKKSMYPVTSSQLRMYALNKIDVDSTNYNMPIVFEVLGFLDTKKIECLLQNMIETHSIFRTYFETVDGSVVQKVAQDSQVELTQRNLSDQKEINRSQLIEHFIKPFDFSRAPLLRVELISLPDDKSLLLIDTAHIISDGRSLNLFIQEFVKRYNGETIKSNDRDYQDYSEWQNNQDVTSQEDYWLEKFSGEIPVINLPLDYPRPQEQSFSGRTIDLEISRTLVEQVKELAKKTDSTEFMIFLAVYMIMLSKYALQENLVVGTPISGRSHPDTEEILGMFVNTLALKGSIEPQKSFYQVLDHVKKVCLEAYDNQDYPFEKLVDKVVTQRSFARNPLFDTMFIFQNEQTPKMKLGNSVVDVIDVNESIAKFDLTLTISERMNESYRLFLNYCTKLFKDSNMAFMSQHYLNLLEGAIRHPNTLIKELSMNDKKEQKQVIEEFNQTEILYDKTETISKRFKNIVSQFGKKKALIFGEQVVTYKELDELSDTLAFDLKNSGVKTGDIVAILMSRSLEAIIAQLGIVKAGGAFVSIDPTYPKARIEFILQDSQSPLVLINDEKNLAGLSYPTMLMQKKQLENRKVSSNVPVISLSSDLMYCIYTSGTTGVPKGVMITQQNVMNLNLLAKEQLSVTSSDNVLQFANYIFDASIIEIYSALLNGGTLHLVTKDLIEDSQGMSEYINEKIDYLILPPQYAMTLNITNIRLLLTGGSSSNAQLVNQIKSVGRYVNGYGPSEGTVCTTMWESENKVLESDVIPIGKPNPNTQAFVLQENLLCGIGVPGELCLAGDSIGLGYLNLPEKTLETFLENPFGEGMMYRTGDLVRWLPDGTLEFLGRMDMQVKVRGYRIELGEIETIIRAQSIVQDVAVISRENNRNETAIYAYLVVKDTESFNLSNFKQELGDSLPDYMIPQYMMLLDNLPTTLSGKLDETALPNIENLERKTLVEASTELEKVLLAIFKEVIGVSELGITDDFYELGGDSINAIRIVSKLRDFGYQLSVKDILKERTIQKLSVLASNKKENVVSKPKNYSGEISLTPIQKYFFENNFPHPNHFNQGLMLKSNSRIDLDKLEKVLEALVDYHGILRAVFKNNRQNILTLEASRKYQINVLDYQNMSADSQAFIQTVEKESNQIQQQINLADGPLLHVALYQSKEADYLLFTIHHLVVDGVSWRILLSDFETAYQQLESNQKISLPTKMSSFYDWSEAVKAYEASSSMKKELPYWESVTEEIIDNKLVSLPLMKDSQQETAYLSLSKSETEQLVFESGKSYGTNVSDLLLTALAQTVHETSEKNKISIQLEGHGREELNENLEIDRVVGWFTSIFPVVIETKADLAESLIWTKEMLRRVPNNGVGYSIARFADKQSLKSITPNIIFNYLGKVDNEISQSKEFMLSDLPVGQLVSSNNLFPNELILNGSVVNDQLSFRLDYRTDKYSTEEMTQFVKIFKEKIIQLVNHCLEQKTSILTASDYDLLTPEGTEELEIIKQVHPNEEINSISSLTPMQLGILYHKVLDEHSSEYLIQQLFNLSGKINEAHLIESLKLVGDRFDMLKTSIVYKKLTHAKQVVLNNRQVETKVINLEASDYSIKEIKMKDLERGFDLEKDSLLRVTIIKEKQNKLSLLLSAHHIILDGWSFPIIFQTIMEIYQQLQSGFSSSQLQTSINLEKEEETKFAEYPKWIDSQNTDEASDYWRHLLSDYETVAGVSSMYSKDEILSQPKKRAESIQKKLSVGEMEKLNYLVKNAHVTINTILEVAWGLVLQAHNHSDDVVFGKVVSGRNAPIKDIEKMIGVFINTIPIRVTSKSQMTIIELLKETQEQSINSSEFDFSSLLDIQQSSKLKNGLFDTLFVFENYFVSDDLQQKSNEFSVTASEVREETNYPITLKCSVSETLRFEILYDNNIYHEMDMVYFGNKLTHILLQIIEMPDKKIMDLSLSDAEEAKTIATEFYNEVVFNEDINNIVELFEKQVEKYSQNIAVMDGIHQVTFEELNHRVNQFAHYLRKTGLKPNELVAITNTKDLDLMVMILAVIKAGGAYVPIDRDAPAERIRYMLTDSGCKRIITGYDDLNFSTTIPVEIYKVNKFKNELTSNLPHVNKMNDLIYCIYTSGTSGRPKGVLLEHANVIAFAQNTSSLFNVEPTDVIGQFANYLFDAFVLEVLVAFGHGLPLVMIPRDIILDPDEFKGFCERLKVTLVIFPPTYYLQSPEFNLRCIVTGGAASNVEIMERATKIGDYYNVYGPTETTVIVTSSYYPKTDNNKKTLTIGQPLPNTRAYVVSQGRLCGIGDIGELWIGGKIVARGYLNQEELTADKFIPNPFDEGRIYKTGDLVRWLPDGSLVYIGRIDKQVQINGYRVELDEIEMAIRNYQRIKDAVVMESAGELLAYVVSDEEVVLASLTKELYHFLPEYMVPKKIQQIPEIPLTLVGKIDESALPKFEQVENRIFKEAKTPLEIKISEQFKSVLKAVKLGIDDDFFLFGGDSIKAMTLLAKLRKENLKITIQDIFKLRTINKLAVFLEENSDEQKKEMKYLSKPTLTLDEIMTNEWLKEIKKSMLIYEKSILEYPISEVNRLSAAQKTSYKMGILNSFSRISVQGKWSESKFKKVWLQLLREYSLLRSSIIINDKKQVWQEYDVTHLKPEIPFIDISKMNELDQGKLMLELMYSLAGFTSKNVYNGRHLMHHLLVVKQSEYEFTLLIPISHLIFDGFSNEVLSDRMTRLYKKTTLEPVNPKDYTDYCEVLNRGPINVSSDEIMSTFELDKVKSSLSYYLDKKERQEYTALKMTFDLSEREIDSEKLFEVTEAILGAAYKFAFPEKNVPLLFVQMGRHYLDKNFSDFVGEFLDVYPEVIDYTQPNTLFKRISHQVKFSREHNINLMAIKETNNSEFKEVNDTLSLINLEKLNLPIVNILLMYQDNLALQKNAFLEKNESKNVEASKYLNVSIKNNCLVFDSLECPSEQKEEMIDELEKVFHAFFYD